jgi:hypothetical protein
MRAARGKRFGDDTLSFLLMYRFHRVFCATSWELEGERRAFHDVLGQVNETDAIHRGVLYTPVSLTSIRDKRPLQYAVEQNIRECVGYVLALTADWGPPERHFERDLRLAIECRQDPALPMRHVEVLLRRPPASSPSFLAELALLDVVPLVFEDLPQFRHKAQLLLSGWLTSEAEAPGVSSPA